jgi:hypothetical protein
VRTILITCGAAALLVGSVPGIAWAGSSGRRNTAIAATAGAAIAWGRYYDARKSESCRPARRVVVTERRPVVHREVVYETRPVVHREVVHVYCDRHKGKKHKQHKHRKHYECDHRGHHRHYDDCDD